MSTDKSIEKPIICGDEINITNLIIALWRSKLLIGVVVFISICTAIIYVKTIPDLYKSETLLMPSTTGSISSSNSLLSQVSGLTGFGGLGAGSGADEVSVALAVLTSKTFIMNFIEQEGIGNILAAATGWNQEESTWIVESKLVQDYNDGKISLLKLAEKFIGSNLNINEDRKTRIIKVSITTFSPLASKSWLEKLVSELNNEMKSRAISDAQKSIQFLEQQIAKTQVSDMKQIFYKLIEDQVKSVMLANVREEYILKTIDAPIVPEEKSGPARIKIAFLICAFGFFVGCLIVISLGLYRSNNS